MLTKIVRRDRIHVMDDWISMNLVTLNAQIASVVSDDDGVSKIPPFPRRVEPLVDPTLETKGRFAYSPVQTKVIVPFLDGRELPEPAVGSSHRTSDRTGRRKS